jgi:hypothetical protein
MNLYFGLNVINKRTPLFHRRSWCATLDVRSLSHPRRSVISSSPKMKQVGDEHVASSYWRSLNYLKTLLHEHITFSLNSSNLFSSVCMRLSASVGLLYRVLADRRRGDSYAFGTVDARNVLRWTLNSVLQLGHLALPTSV